MAPIRGTFLRDNAFLVAAVALPAMVAGLFILASAIPRWTVPSPGYDLILKAQRPYNQSPPAVLVDFNVRDGRVEATLHPPAPPAAYGQSWALLRYDHETMRVEEIALDLPVTMRQDEPPRTMAVESLAAIRVTPQSSAPDGYELQTRTNGSAGLVGSIFGMGRYRQSAALVNQGRIVQVNLPSPFGDPYQSAVYAVGWVIDEGMR